MKSIQLILGTYNYQPEGNFDFIFERAYQKAYKPFLSLLNNFPDIPVVLHYSGSLLSWMEDRHPEFHMLLREMVARKQVELLGGGYYEPILTLIPDSDKLGQIEKLTTYLRANFGTRPRGSWIAERIWEPSLARILKNSGMDYTFLDDRFFRIAGLEEKDLYYPYLTEEQGKTIMVIPMSLALRDMVPYRRPEEIIEVLSGLADESGERVVALLVEGERLGEWDETYACCYEKKWLEAFFNIIVENRSWINPITPRRSLKQISPRGRIYFPSLSYRDMMKWVLTSSRQKRFLELDSKIKSEPDKELFFRGGDFRQFLTKYPEINLLYSRMIYTHLLVNQMRSDKYKKKSAKNELWKGQSNAVYWHGQFCGIYANHLRKSVYRAFLEAEKITRDSITLIPSIIRTDFDMDGQEEFLYQGKDLNAFIHKRGGSVIELDFLPATWNYLDTMSRWPESYHQKKSEGCDWYCRKSFLDHFFTPNTTIDSFDNMAYTELGDFIDRFFELAELKREHNELILEKNGSLRLRNRLYPFQIQKRYLFKRSSLDVYFTLTNRSEKPLDLWYGLEVNLALASKGMESVRIFGAKGNHRFELGSEKVESSGLDSLLVKDVLNEVEITLITNIDFLLWSLPVETITLSPFGIEKIYQSSCFVLSWKISLEPGEQWETRISLALRKV